MAKTKISTKKVMLALLWTVVAAGAIFLFAAASHSKDLAVCEGVSVNIASSDNSFLLDKMDIVRSINYLVGGKAKGRPVKDFNLVYLEDKLIQNVWVSEANVYFDRNGILHADVMERNPVAHIFSMNGNGFYLDSNLQRLPQTDRVAPRLPVFTGFPNEEKGKLTTADSGLLTQIKVLSSLLVKDTFLMAMVDQVDIQKNQFDLIPKLGNQVIVFGDTSHAVEKMDKLKLFYKEVMQKAGGWSKYSSIDLSFKDQVVAKVRGKEDKAEDSLRTIQLLDIIAWNAAMLASDSLMAKTPEKRGQVSTDVSMIQSSVEREEEPETGAGDEPSIPAAAVAPAVKAIAPRPVAASKPAAEKPAPKPVVKKVAATKPLVKATPKPAAKAPAKKAVMVPAKSKPAVPPAKKASTATGTKTSTKAPVKATTRTTAKPAAIPKKTAAKTGTSKPKAIMPKGTKN